MELLVGFEKHEQMSPKVSKQAAKQTLKGKNCCKLRMNLSLIRKILNREIDQQTTKEGRKE